MNWFYAVGGQQQGPVDDARLNELIATGVINVDTLVWREGMPNWQPLRQARPIPPVAPPSGTLAAGSGSPGTTTPAPGSDQVECAECGRFFSRDDVIQYGPTSVCAACKPVFLQRLREGAAPSVSGTGNVNEEQLLARDYRIEIGDCLSRAWNLFTTHAAIVAGVSLLVGLAYLAVACFIGVVGVIAEAVLPPAARYFTPLMNQGFMAIVTGPFAGGYFWFLLRLARGEQAGVHDAFAGFRQRFVPLVVCSLAQGLVQLAFMAPMLLLVTRAGLRVTRRGGVDMSPALLPAIFGTVVIAIIGMNYFATVWIHAYLLIMDKGYQAGAALKLSFRMVHKRWWMTWVFLFVGGLIAGGGALACCVGILVTFPLYLAMRVWLYDDNFRDLAPVTPV
ncbi:MAG: hypothetical protein QOF48_3179 [Verrucomicrobiota bacterium]|jgi:hypothetical protein